MQGDHRLEPEGLGEIRGGLEDVFEHRGVERRGLGGRQGRAHPGLDPAGLGDLGEDDDGTRPARPLHPSAAFPPAAEGRPAWDWGA